MTKIRSINDVRMILKKQNIKIFGIGGTPITRTEVYHFTDDFEIICSVDAQKEIQVIGEKMKITCFPLRKENGAYIKKPSKLLTEPAVQEYINASKSTYEKIAIIVMKPDRLLEQICRENEWILIGNSADKIEKYNDKERFQSILHSTGLANDAIVLPLSELSGQLDAIFDKLGEKIVIQLPVSGGGHGTFFFTRAEKDSIKNEIDQRSLMIKADILPSTKIIINSFFDGPTLSILGTITKDHGILAAHPQHQLIDIPGVTKGKNDASGIFCGHEWTLPIPQHIEEQSINIVKKIGLYLKEDDVDGIFGTDLVWDTQRNIVVPIEINARLTGVFPSFVDVQLFNEEIPIMAFHIMDFLNIPYEVDQNAYRSGRGFSVGAHLLVFNPYPHKIRVTNIDLCSGVYSLKEDQLYFERDGFEMSDIKNDGEFLITDGVPTAGAIYDRNRKLLKIISKNSLAQSSYDLNVHGKKIVDCVYNAITCEKYE